MRAVRVMIALLSAALILTPSAAAAETPVWDLDPAAGTGHAAVGRTANVRLTIHNYGPSNWAIGFWIDLTAPGGTVFGSEAKKELARVSSTCQYATDRRLRCRFGYSIPIDGSQVNQRSPYSMAIPIKVVSKCTTPGRVRLDSPYDPKSSNNTATFRIKVDGVDPTVCLKPTAKPSPSMTVVPSAGVAPPTESAAASESASSSPAEVPVAVAEPEPASGSGMSAAGFITGGVAVLLGVALLVGVLLRGRNRRTDSDDDEGALGQPGPDGQNDGL